MTNRIYLPFLIFFLMTIKSWSSGIVQQQNTGSNFQFKEQKSISLITGFQTGSYSFVEIGLGFKNDMISSPHPSTTIFGITNELKLNKDFVWGLKLGAWTGGGVGGTNIGLNLINYTDFKDNAIRFRPEIGMGFGSFRMIYGYNFPITNKDFNEVNSHLFGINILLDIKDVDQFKLF